MIRAGDSIENPVTGERLMFHLTSAETGGEKVVFETFVQPHGFAAATHVHPSQEERFDVLSGSVGFRAGRTKLVAGPGEHIVIPAGTAHTFWNAGDDVARFLCEVRPALQFEQLIETMFGLASAGRTNRKGMPNPLQLAVVARHHFDDVRLPYPPVWMQRVGLAVAAPLGRLLGYRATFTLGAPPAETMAEAA
jgi:mannose-6-phosphate isomerase-like protein (cupin superfamily)